MFRDDRGKRVYEAGELPAAPRGSRILVKPDEPDDQTVTGLKIPDVAKNRVATGVILSAGLAAHDQMHDHLDKVGDRVWWGLLAGVWQEWDHIVKPGKDASCGHNEPDCWSRHPCTRDRTNAFACKCGAIRWQEAILLMDVDDLQANEDLEERKRKLSIVPVNDPLPDGKTHYVYANVTEQGGN